MIVNAREVATDERVVTDVCIIGGGPAGLTLAAELARIGISIVVLEGGGKPGSPQGLTEPAVTLAEGDFEAPPAVPRRFGGAANEWIVRLPWMRRGVRMLPLSRCDLEVRDWIPNSGWPIGWSELDRYYRRAHDRLRLGAWGYDVDQWEGAGIERFPLDAEGFTASIERFPRSSIYTQQAWAELSGSSTVRVILDAPVGELEGDDDRVHSAAVDSIGHPGRFRVVARAFVVAAGGIENARLLLASRSGLGYGNQHDNVGRYYMDHVRMISGVLRPIDPSLFDRSVLYDIDQRRGGLVMAKITPTADLMHRHEILNSGAMLLPELSDEVGATLSTTRSAVHQLMRGRKPSADVSVRAMVSGLAKTARTGAAMVVRQRRFPPRTDAGWARLGNNADRYSTFAVEHQFEQAPVRSNRIRLAQTAAATGRDLPELIWKWSDIDLASIRTTQRLFAEACSRSAVGEFVATPWEELPELTTPSGAFHPMGATRMTSDPASGVVDPDCKINDVANLFVAGSSVFPTGGYANPTLTLIALSIRLGDHLAGSLPTLPN